MSKKILIMNSKDNVGVALEDLKAGQLYTYDSQEIKALEDIPFGHKIALKDFSSQEIVCKYGEKIGFVLENVARGQWIHNHNMGCKRGK